MDLSKIKNLYEIQKKARAVQKELKDIEIEVSSNDGWITAVFNGEQHLTGIQIDEDALRPENKREIEKDLKNVISQGISRAQAIAAEKMKDVAGGLGIPGM
ncbi:MAG: YbaB/EbfC family nucleoid-associated protein [Candidatus Berkelbacteria bacterium]